MELTKAFTLRNLLLYQFGGDGFHYFGGDVLIECFFKEFDFEIFAEVFD
jgi:hypothetical protein